MDASPRPTSSQLEEAYAEATRTTILGLLVSVVLAAIKIAAGLAGSSYALVADGVESVLDLFSSLLVWSGLRVSTRPSTAEYPYGRGKAEPLAALAVATVLLIAAGGIAVGAVEALIRPQGPPAAFTLAVLVVVVVGKELIFRMLFARGTEVGSRAMRADAWHHRSDALTSLAAFIGISVALVGGEGWATADDWAALVACGIIAWNGLRLFRGSVRDILDAAAPPEVRDRVRSLAASVARVAGVEEVRVRRSGLAYLVDIHVEVDGSISVDEGHEIAHAVKDRLLDSELPILDALVHIEPAASS